jgi:hypothetical protein
MDKERLKKLGSDPRFIPGIYNYCDRWCERCAFTARCMNFAVCEEEANGLEDNDINNEKFWEKLHEVFRVTLEMVRESAQEMGVDLEKIKSDDELEQHEQLQSMAKENPCAVAAREYIGSVDKWFKSTGPVFEQKAEELQTEAYADLPTTDPELEAGELEEAMEVIRWYQHLIYVKLLRAVKGLLEKASESIEYARGDAEGSAKVALVGMDRSIGAWGQLMRLLPGQDDAILNVLVELERLRRMTEQAVPGARDFVRPGLDK